jgi:hypothetical protein
MFDPPRYEWTAETAAEADAALGAARDLIDAHINTLAPVSGNGESARARRETPVRLLISLDLTGAVDRINRRQAEAER